MNPDDSVDPATDPAATTQRLQILGSEFSSLVAARSLAWSETFSRTTMFLATLSGSMVALALVAQSSEFGTPFRVFALVILPVVLFVGKTTVARLGASNYHAAMCVIGMNRIRHAYLEIAPDLRPLFVLGTNDDAHGVMKSMGLPPGQPTYQHFLSSTPTLITIIDAIIAGVITVLVLSFFELSDWLSALGAVAGFAAILAFHQIWALRSIGAARAGLQPLYPTPE